MEIIYSTKSEPVSASGTVTVYHGSALVYCNEIADTGLNYERMVAACPGAYAHCTSVSFKVAIGYAPLNPLVYMAGHPPGVVKYELPLDTVQDFRAKGWARWVLEDQAYEFFRETFDIINRERTAVSVIPLTGTTLTFDE
jgi:hypothetical protein